MNVTLVSEATQQRLLKMHQKTFALAKEKSNINSLN